MYVCICKGVTDRDIQRAVDNGAPSFLAVQQQLEVSTQCGSCESLARSIVAERLATLTPGQQFYDAATVQGSFALA